MDEVEDEATETADVWTSRCPMNRLHEWGTLKEGIIKNKKWRYTASKILRKYNLQKSNAIMSRLCKLEKKPNGKIVLISWFFYSKRIAFLHSKLLIGWLDSEEIVASLNL